MDLARFFDTMPHREILMVLAERIADRAFLRLIARMLKAGCKPQGVWCTTSGAVRRAPSARP
jgi:RNA-directed DNA polymerase